MADIPEEDILGMINVQVSSTELDQLWDQIGYGTTADSMLQSSAAMDEVLESTLTALARNVKGLLDTTGEQEATLAATTDKVAANTAAIESLKQGGADTGALQDIFSQLNELLAFKEEATAKMQVAPRRRHPTGSCPALYAHGSPAPPRRRCWRSPCRRRRPTTPHCASRPSGAGRCPAVTAAARAGSISAGWTTR